MIDIYGSKYLTNRALNPLNRLVGFKPNKHFALISKRFRLAFVVLFQGNPPETKFVRVSLTVWSVISVRFNSIQNGVQLQSRLVERSPARLLQAAVSLRALLPVAWSRKHRQDLLGSEGVFVHPSGWHLHSVSGKASRALPIFTCPWTVWHGASFFFTFLFYPPSSCQTFFLPLISTPSGFHDWGLVTSSQFYKAFTGLHLQVCKYRANFNAICRHKYCLIPYVNACFHS